MANDTVNIDVEVQLKKASDFSKSLKTFDGDITALRNKINSLQEQFSKSPRKYYGHIMELRAAFKDLSPALNSAEANFKNMLSELGKSSQAWIVGQNNIAKYTEELSKLQAKRAVLETRINKGTKISGTTEELSAVADNIHTYEAKLSSYVARLTEAKTDLDRLKQAQTAYKNAIVDTQKKLTELDANKENMTNKSYVKQREHLVKVEEDWRNKLTTTTTQLRSLRGVIAGVTPQINIYQKKLDEAREEQSRLLSPIQYSEEELNNLKSELNDVINKITEYSNKINSIPKDSSAYAREGVLGKLGSEDFNTVWTKFNEGADLTAEELQSIIALLTRVENVMSQVDTTATSTGDSLNESFRGSNVGHTASQFDRLNHIVARVKSAFKSVIGVFKNVLGTIKKVSSKVADLAKKFTSLFKSTSKGSKGLNLSTKKLFKTFMQFGLGARSLYFLIRRLRTEFISAMKEMAAEFPEINAQISAFTMALKAYKGSFMTMIQPIVSAVIPVLMNLLGVLTQLNYRFAEFFATLTGQKVIYKAVANNVDYAESVDEVTDATKEANKALGEYDNLLVIPQDTLADTSSSKDGDDANDLGYTFEKAEIGVSEFARRLKAAWENADFEGVGKIISHKFNYIVGTIEDWITNTFEPKGTEWASKIMRIVNGFFSDWDAEKTGEALSNFFNSIFRILNTAITTLNWSQVGTKIGNFIVSAINNFDAVKAGETVRNLISGILTGGISLLQQNPGGELGTKLASFINSLFSVDSGGLLGSFFGNLVNNITSFFKKLFEGINWETIKESVIKNAQTFFDTIDLKSTLGLDIDTSRIATILEPIGNVVAGIFSWFQTIDLSGIIGSILGLLERFTPLIETIWGILEPVLTYAVNDMFPRLNNTTGVLFQGVNDFLTGASPLISAVAEFLMEIGTHVTEIVNSGLSTVLSIVGELLGIISPILTKILNVVRPIFEKISEFTSSLFTEVLDIVLTLLEPLEPILTAIFDILSPLFDILGPIFDIIIDITDLALTPLIHLIKAFVKFITGDFEGAMDEMGGMFTDMKDKVGKLRLDFKKLHETFKESAEKIVKKVIEIGKSIATWATNLWGTVSGFFTRVWDSVSGWFSGLWENIKSIFSGVGEFFTGLWEDIWNPIKSVINGMLSGIENFVNAIIGGINAIIKALNGLSFDVPEWIPGLGGKHFGFNIGELGKVTLPRLAQGAVIPPNSEFLAVLGDQKAGTNIEAPLDTIKQAVAEVMASMQGTSMPEKIQIVMPNGKVLAETVWDEERKLYKQTGSYSPKFA